jgi:hypothetical protein
MPNVRVAAFIFAGSLLLTIVLGAIGNLVPPPRLPQPEMMRIAGMTIFFTLFLLMAFSAIPLMVEAVFGGRVGQRVQVPVRVRAVAVWVLWGLMAAGLTIAIPFAASDGFFSSGPAKR